MLQGSCSVEVWDREGVAPPLEEKMRDVEGLLTYGHEPVSRQMILSARHLRSISVMGVGYDHVDIRAAAQRGIPVGHTPGVLDETVADMTFALLLAAARNVIAGHQFVRSGKWSHFDPNRLWGVDVHDSLLGIIGMGRVGYAVARRARAFRMRVLYCRRHRRRDWERELGVEYAALDDLLDSSDFVTLHVPLTPQTRHLIGARELGRMKPGAILVNMVRGPVVDTQALYEAARDGKIGAAALDVTDPEPLPPDHPLLTLDNVFLCPHLGSATVQTRTRMARMAVENLLAGLQGRPPPYPVPDPPSPPGD